MSSVSDRLASDTFSIAHGVRPGGSDARCRAHPLGQPPHVLGAAGAVAAEIVEAVREIGVVAAEPALDEEGGDVCGSLASAPSPASREHHARQARRQRQRADALAGVCDAARRVERADCGEFFACRCKRGGGRRIEP